MSAERSSSLAAHTVKGSLYSVGSSGVTLLLGMIRASLMARFLIETDKGVAALALLFISLVSQFSGIGLANAYVHRKEGGESLRATYLSLNVALSGGVLLLLALLAPVLTRFYPGYDQLQAVIYAFIGIHFIKTFNTVQNSIMSKRLAFGRLSIIDVAASVVMTIVGPWMAWSGFGAWSIAAENASGVLTRAFFFNVLYRPWRIRFGWDWPTVRWFWQYGVKVWAGTNINYVLNHFDDFWVSFSLGNSPFGFYSQAYDFATYSRRVVSNPILAVFFPAFARMQEDRLRLSRAFFRATSLMVRFSCLFSLVFVLTAPEFIALILGEHWLPMQAAFQLMIIYTLFDPLSTAASNLLLATGLPGAIARTRVVQLFVFVPAVILLAAWAGIAGVALAADLMILTGTVLLFHHTHRVADYSARVLWFWPLAGLLITAGAVLALNPLWSSLPIYAAFAAKIVFIPTLFSGFLLLTERKQLLTGWNMVWGLVKSFKPAPR